MKTTTRLLEAAHTISAAVYGPHELSVQHFLMSILDLAFGQRGQQQIPDAVLVNGSVVEIQIVQGF